MFPRSTFTEVLPTSSTYRMADRLLAGRLAELLRSYRQEQLGAEAIASRLYAEAGVEVSGETVRRWCISLDISTTPDEGAA